MLNLLGSHSFVAPSRILHHSSITITDRKKNPRRLSLSTISRYEIRWWCLLSHSASIILLSVLSLIWRLSTDRRRVNRTERVLTLANNRSAPYKERPAGRDQRQRHPTHITDRPTTQSHCKLSKLLQWQTASYSTCAVITMRLASASWFRSSTSSFSPFAVLCTS